MSNPTAPRTITLTITVTADATDAQADDLNKYAAIVARDASERMKDTTRARSNNVMSSVWIAASAEAVNAGATT